MMYSNSTHMQFILSSYLYTCMPLYKSNSHLEWIVIYYFVEFWDNWTLLYKNHFGSGIWIVQESPMKIPSSYFKIIYRFTERVTRFLLKIFSTMKNALCILYKRLGPKPCHGALNVSAYAFLWFLFASFAYMHESLRWDTSCILQNRHWAKAYVDLHLSSLQTIYTLLVLLPKKRKIYSSVLKPTKC